MGSHTQTLNRNSNYSKNMILATTLLCLLPFSLSSPIEILSYTADDSSHSHSHTMLGIPGKEVSGNFQFEAPDTENVFHLSYTADDQGFQAVGDHLPVSVKVPEMELPVMVCILLLLLIFFLLCFYNSSCLSMARKLWNTRLHERTNDLLGLLSDNQIFVIFY